MAILESIRNFDREIFLNLNGIHSPFWDYVMTLFTFTPTWALFYLVILVIITKKFGRKALLVYLSIFLIILLSDQISGLIKDSVMRLRPSNDPEVSPFAHIFFKKGGMYGFVSAHAANAFSFAVFSSLLFRNRIYSLFIFPWALLIAYTRIYLGVHYPGDILGGALLGGLVGWGIYHLMLLRENRIYPMAPFAKNRLTEQETSIILATGLALIIISMTTIALLMKNGVI